MSVSQTFTQNSNWWQMPPNSASNNIEYLAKSSLKMATGFYGVIALLLTHSCEHTHR
jgi:hypothetical protein